MRLYLKLILVVSVAALIQRCVIDSGAGREGWFVARCAIANWTGDVEFEAELIDEGRVLFYGGEPPNPFVYASAGGGGTSAG